MNRLLTVLAATALLAGCGESGAPKQGPAATPAPAVPAAGSAYVDLPPEAVLMTVNGFSLTKLDVETDLTLQLALMRMTTPNVKADRIQREQDRVARKTIEGFARRRVMIEEADRRGITVTPAEIEAVKTNFVAAAFRGKKMTYAEMRGKLRPAMQKKIDADLALDARLFKLDKIMAEETAYKPTDAEVAEKLVKFADYNKRTRKLEAEIWAQASNTWQRIQGGEAFEKAGKQAVALSAHNEYEEEWGTFELSFFNDAPELKACLSVMKIGQVTPPVVADNGIVIVKLLDIGEPTQVGQNTRYLLSEIRFALPEYYNAYTAETLKAELAKEKSKRQLKAKVDAMVSAASIAYPSGTVKQLFPKNQDIKVKGAK